MRKFVAIGMMIALAGGGSLGTVAAQDVTAPQDIAAALGNGAPSSASGTVTGTAQGPNLQGLSTVRVQIRNTESGEVVGTTTTTEAGEFTFSGLPSANYVVEVVDGAGKILGIGAPFSLPAGTTATASVMSLAPGAAAGAAAGSGFSLFGLGPVTSLTVLGAASAASVTAVVATRPDASPSR